MNPGRAGTAALAAVVTVMLAGCSAPDPTASPSPPSTTTSAPSSATAADPSTPAAAPMMAPPTREGQAADPGRYPPLAVPAGIRFGVGVMPAVYTRAGEYLEAGDVAVVDGTQCDMTAPAAVLISVDTVTGPLQGPERDQVLAELGYDPGTRQIVQRIELRIRQIGGVDAGASWRTPEALQVLSYGFHLPMPLLMPAGDTPLDGHGVSTGNTVQVIVYAAGTPDEHAATPLEAVQLHIGCRTDNATVSVNSPYLGDLVGGDE